MPSRLVLGDANVLYSRVLRDYLLYAASRQLIRVYWSADILGEVVQHLTANVAGFTAVSGARLVAAMNDTFPYSQVTPSEKDYRKLKQLTLDDENDRHVLAAAIAAEADVLCTDNIKHFPPDIMAELAIEALTADNLLTLMIEEFGAEMVAVHRIVVTRLPGATDESTIAALHRANAINAANLLAALIGIE